jgi:hypothetical protein
MVVGLRSLVSSNEGLRYSPALVEIRGVNGDERDF